LWLVEVAAALGLLREAVLVAVEPVVIAPQPQLPLH
jgi:hypothetical protein